MSQPAAGVVGVVRSSAFVLARSGLEALSRRMDAHGNILPATVGRNSPYSRVPKNPHCDGSDGRQRLTSRLRGTTSVPQAAVHTAGQAGRTHGKGKRPVVRSRPGLPASTAPRRVATVSGSCSDSGCVLHYLPGQALNVRARITSPRSPPGQWSQTTCPTRSGRSQRPNRPRRL